MNYIKIISAVIRALVSYSKYGAPKKSWTLVDWVVINILRAILTAPVCKNEFQLAKYYASTRKTLAGAVPSWQSIKKKYSKLKFEELEVARQDLSMFDSLNPSTFSAVVMAIA